MYKRFGHILLGLLWFGWSTLSAQDITPKGQFQIDSVKIGISIPYSLSISYPTSMDVVFPDSLHDFSPFEFESKEYFPTHSDSTSSYDSAVYYLSTFEVDSIQYLQLPIYFVNNTDSIPAYTAKDSVFLVELIPVLPDSVQLIENTTYFNVPTAFNYPYLLVGLGILFVVVIVVLIVFGKKIRNYFKIRKLKKRQVRFLKDFDDITYKASSSDAQEVQERAAFVWKSYIEKLEKQPVTKLTTKEIAQILQPTEEVVGSLKAIDRAIYSNKAFDGLKESYNTLRADAIKRCETQIASIKENG